VKAVDHGSGPQQPGAYWPEVLVMRVISGGQTGVDRAALDWAIEHGIEHGGSCPRGRRAEDGAIPVRYRLNELGSASYRARTRENVNAADATPVLNVGPLDGGAALTVRFAEQTRKPCIVIDLAQPSAGRMVASWLPHLRPRVLNIAGPRESKRPGVGRLARAALDEALIVLTTA
jgi:hypothetical protein